MTTRKRKEKPRSQGAESAHGQEDWNSLSHIGANPGGHRGGRGGTRQGNQVVYNNNIQHNKNPDVYRQHISSFLLYMDDLDARNVEHPLIRSYIALRDGLSEFTSDIYSLLGFDAPQTYIIVLQNAAEARPNGGFFGSFALLTLDAGRVSKLEIIDSYHPARENE